MVLFVLECLGDWVLGAGRKITLSIIMATTHTPTTLVLNSGSSSLKFAVYVGEGEEALVSGLAERLNGSEASLSLVDGSGKVTYALDGGGHEEALRMAIEKMQERGVLVGSPDVIGHRIVHGGEHFSEPALITDEVVALIESCSHLAPLHNPAGLLGIDVARQIFAETPQVAVFDTSFHQTLKEEQYLYALPQYLYREHGVRRYGFHGSSHGYVVEAAARQVGFDLANSRVLSAHLGNGCSTCAVLDGLSVDTSMGLTPLEGLVMGTRSGDVDPGLILFLESQLGMSSAEVSEVLNKKSGLLGLSGISNDMRELWQHAEAGSEEAALAIEIFCFRAAKSLASLMVALGGLDTLIFTGGIGENDGRVREKIVKHLGYLGLVLDGQRNASAGAESNGVISAESSEVAVVVVETREEWMIARLSQKVVSAS